MYLNIYSQLCNRLEAIDIRLTILEKSRASIDKPRHNYASNTILEPMAVANEEQQQAIDWAVQGKSFVMVGPAGSGKTWAVNKLAETRLSSNVDINPSPLPLAVFRDPRGNTSAQEEKPAIAFVAFTNRAVNNMANNLRKYNPELMDELFTNFMTIHKLLEVAPEYYYDADSGKDKMRFTPRRDALNRLPIKTLVIEEASMVDLELWGKLFSALEPDTQIILLGDLNQLPPVFGDSILNYALIQLPIVELTHIYRQALDSPIIRQMTNCRQGIPPVNDTEDFTIVHGNNNRPVGPDKMGTAIAGINGMLDKLHTTGQYDPMNDMVLSAFNKHGCGTKALNRHISTWLDHKLRLKGTPRTIYEIRAGIVTHYYAVGDAIYDGLSKSTAIITSIHRNGNFHGTPVQQASTNLSRYGIMIGEGKDDLSSDFFSDDIEFSTNVFNIEDLQADANAVEDKVIAASHVISLELDNGEIVERNTAGEINLMDFGYCLTTHKAQGCEWRKVFVVIHKSHTLANREWLYTAGTRAREECFIIAKEDVLANVVARQRIKGDTLEAKVLSFNEKLLKIPVDERKQITFARIN